MVAMKNGSLAVSAGSGRLDLELHKKFYLYNTVTIWIISQPLEKLLLFDLTQNTNGKKYLYP